MFLLNRKTNVAYLTYAAYLFAVSVILLVIYAGMTHLSGAWETLVGRIRFLATVAALSARSDWKTPPAPLAANAKEEIFGIPVLLYHGIVKEPDRFNLTQERFAEHMRALADAGYRTISVSDLEKYLSGTADTLPAKSFLLTFDDGRRDSYYGADPVLYLLGYRAAMFVPTGPTLTQTKKSSYYLSRPELQAMVESGRWEIHSHAVQKEGGRVLIDAKGTEGNFLSDHRWNADSGKSETAEEYRTRITTELVDSYNAIVREFDTPALSFSYPFGDYGQQSSTNRDASNVIFEIVRHTYALAFRQVWPADSGFTLNYPGESRYLVRRIEPSPELSGAELLALIERGYAKPLPYLVSSGGGDGWKLSWGTITYTSEKMTIASRGEGTGAFAFLDGTYPWKNYHMRVTGEHAPEAVITLVARYVGPEAYAGCLFDHGIVRIVEVTGNESRIIASGRYTNNGSAQSRYAIAVAGRAIACDVGGVRAVAGELSGKSKAHGGIGIRVWSRNPSDAWYDLHALAVVPIIKIADDVFREEPEEEQNTKTSVPTSSLATPTVVPPPASRSLLPPSAKNIIVPLLQPTSVPPATTSTPVSLPASASALMPGQWSAIGGTGEGTAATWTIATLPGQTGAYYWLPGSSGWTDYRFALTASWKRGTSFALIARATDPKNFMECLWTRGARSGSATLTIVEHGKRIPIYQSGKLLLYGDGEYADARVAIEVEGTTVRCLFNDIPVITYDHARIAPKGGIGMRIWDRTPGGVEVLVTAPEAALLARPAP